MKKKRPTQLSSIDLQKIFLAEMRATAPEIIYDLDQTQDISQWARKWGFLNAPWIINIATGMKGSRRGQIDRLDLSTDPIGNSLSRDEGAESPEAYRARVLAAWDKSVEYQAAFRRLGEEAFANTPIQFAPVVATKRDAQTHCRMLLLHLLDLTDQQIAVQTRYKDVSTIGVRRRELADLLGLELPSQRGRPKK